MDSRIMTQEELAVCLLALRLAGSPEKADAIERHVAAITEQRDALLKAAEPVAEMAEGLEQQPNMAAVYVARNLLLGLAEAVRKCEE